MVRTESLEIKDGRKKAMQCLAHTESRAQFSPACSETIEIPEASGNLYRTLQQEVELGAQALRSERADMAVTFFQSALQKISLTDPFTIIWFKTCSRVT